MWKDFKWVEKRFGTKFANILKGFDKGSKEIEEHFTTNENHEVTFTDANGVQNTLVTEQGIPEVLAKNGLIEVKWQELKDKRDNGQLIPGSLYRITDYNCTTTQENTRSAGHQFDIVLLALSENKLAEEGWAMEHPTDVYDVTFSDNVTKKCYIYKRNEQFCNIVDINTLFGTTEKYFGHDAYVSIDEESKTCVCRFDSSDLNIEDCQYSYFQNSNLSAWKVWYCLDNDTSRFAWAQEEIPIVTNSIICDTSIDTNKEYVKGSGTALTVDGIDYYYWGTIDHTGGCYTTNLTPTVGDKIYTRISYVDILQMVECGTIISVNMEGGIPAGKGVIYRLIDEWNNDVPYDFKNIQFIRPLTDGEYDADNGEDNWCYTFSYWYNDRVIDSSTEGQTFTDDGEDIVHICENTIKARNIRGKYELSNNVIYSGPDGEWYYGAKCINIDGNSNINTILGDSNISLNYSNQTIIEGNVMLLYACFATSFSDGVTIYIGNKKVLTQDALDNIETLLNNI